MSEKAAATRDKLLDAAIGLMIARGYEATGVEDICKAARVTKGSFFHHFESKEALAKEAVERFSRAMGARFAGRPELRREDPLERLLAWPDAVVAMAKDGTAPKGCLIGTFAQEVSATHDDLRRTCEGLFAQGAGSIREMIEEAVARHKPKAKIDARTLADHFIVVSQGALILAKARKDPAPMIEAMAHLKRYLLQLFGR